MKNRNNEIKKYIEAIIYSIVLILLVLLMLTGNLYIEMIPIGIIIGVLGQITLGKRAMTSFFTCILSILILQMRNPKILNVNIVSVIKITILVLIGELLGWSAKRLYRLYKNRKRVTKKIKRERVVCATISVITFVTGIILSGFFNGNYPDYFKARNSLKKYLLEEYKSSSRFNIVSSKYECSLNSRYIFNVEDTKEGNSGKFSVYINDIKNIQDEYLIQSKKSKIKTINENIKHLNTDNITLIATIDNINLVNITISKSVDNIEKNVIESYAKEIVDYINQIKIIDQNNEIDKIKIILESKNNKMESISSYIFLEGYNSMLEEGNIEAYEYILKALNIEYFD